MSNIQRKMMWCHKTTHKWSALFLKWTIFPCFNAPRVCEKKKNSTKRKLFALANTWSAETMNWQCEIWNWIHHHREKTTTTIHIYIFVHYLTLICVLHTLLLRVRQQQQQQHNHLKMNNKQTRKEINCFDRWLLCRFRQSIFTIN